MKRERDGRKRKEDTETLNGQRRCRDSKQYKERRNIKGKA